MTPERSNRLRALSDQQLAEAKDHSDSLGLLTLHGHETRRRAHGRFADRLGIGSVVLLALNDGLT